MTDEALLRQYLLGQLPAPDRDALEDRLFADANLLEQLAQVETDLFDAAARHQLSPAELAAWQAYLSAHPPAQAFRTRFAAAFAKNAPPAPLSAPLPAPLPASPPPSRRFAWFAATAAALALLAFFWWNFPSPRPTTAEPVVFAFSLQPGTLRDNSQPQVLRLPARATHLRLDFPNTPTGAQIALRHIDSEALLWEGPATAGIPRTTLRPGDCLATLRNPQGQDLADAVFLLSLE